MDSYYLGVSVIFCYSLISLFFFFKQKTAYEMRISDWSSDVCSSDLRERGAELTGQSGGLRLDACPMGGLRRRSTSGSEGKESTVETPWSTPTTRYCKKEKTKPTTPRFAMPSTWQEETGRSTCRERVCQ